MCEHWELLLPAETGFARLSTRVQICLRKGLVGTNSGPGQDWGQRGALQNPPFRLVSVGGSCPGGFVTVTLRVGVSASPV